MAGAVENFLDDLFSRVVNSLLTIGITAAIGGVGSALVLLWASTTTIFAIGIGLSVFGVVLILGWVVMVNYRKRKLMYVSYPSPGFHLKVVEKTISYVIDDGGVLNFKRTIELKALVDNVSTYTDRFLWTGGKCNLPTAGTNVVEVRENMRAGIWTYYDSILDRSLRRGEQRKITINWPKLENAWQSRPFVSTATEEPTEKIIFDVTVPSKFRKNDKVTLEEMRSIESISPFKVTDGSFDDDDHYKVEISARPYAHYRVSWHWSEGLPDPGAEVGAGVD